MEQGLRTLRRVFCLAVLGALVLGCGDSDNGSPGSADTTSPQVAVTSHTDGEQVTGSRTITLEGTLVDDSTIVDVSVALDGMDQPAFFSQSGFLCIMDLADGNNAIVVTAEDDSGNVSNTQITLIYLAGFPVVTITSHTDGEQIAGARTINLEGTLADDSAIVDVSVTLDGVDQPAFFSQSGFLCIMDLADGNNAIVVSAEDDSGNVSDTQITLTYLTGAPVVTVTSHANGDRVTGSREVWLSGTLADDSTIVSVAVTLNGVDQPAFFTQENFTSVVTMENGDNTAVVTATDIEGTSGVESLDLYFPFLAIANHAAADTVIGQADFSGQSANRGGSAAADTLNDPYGNPYVYNGVMYVGDYGNNRTLGFDQVPIVNGAAADFVIGQPDLLSTSNSTLADGADGSQTVQVYGGKLFINNFDSNSIYIYDSVPTATGAIANVVVGQTDFGIGANACTASSLDSPESFTVAGGKLIVADSNNNRVLVWNAIPTSNGAPADLVIGQSGFTTCIGGGSAASLSYPSDVWSDGERLLVVDQNNHRVLQWNTFPSASGQPADLVLGDESLNDPIPGTTQRDFRTPYFVASNGNQIFVSDADNNRVMVWDRFPTLSYAPADRVLGQSDFLRSVADDNDGVGGSDSAPGARGLEYPTGIYVADDALFVSDNSNNRILVFRPAP